MRPEQFRDTEFLGGRSEQQANPDRLRLFQAHLALEERVRAVMPLKNSVLLVTDRQVLELAPHLEAHGAWNVRGFQGFALAATMALGSVLAVHVEDAPDAPGTKGRLVLRLRGDHEEMAVITEVAGDATRAALGRLRELLLPQRM